MSTPLFELAAQYLDLQRLAEDIEIEPQTLADTLAGLEGSFDEKVIACAKVIANIEADAHAIADTAKRQAARAERLKLRGEGLRAYVKIHMEAVGRLKVDCPDFVVKVKKNPPRVDVIAADEVPPEYKVWPEIPEPTIDRRKLLDALKALPEGEGIAGCRIAQDTRLAIEP